MMKWLHYGLWVVLLGVSTSPVLGVTAAPRVTVEQSVYNFGDQSNSQTIEHTFVLRNEGTVTLEITNIRSSCGCTVGNVSSRSVEPGGTSEITAAFNLRGRHGPQRSTLTVETNDPSNPRLHLTMSGVATQDFNIQPSSIFFGQQHTGATEQRSFEVVGAPNVPFEIRHVETEAEFFAVSEPVARSPYHYSITVTLNAPGEPGMINDAVRLHTTHPQYPTVHVQVSAQVAGRLTVAPNAITLVSGNEAPVTRYVVVRPGAVRQFEVTGVDVPADDIRVHILNMQNQGYRIQLTNLRADAGLAGQSIRIHTNVEGMEEISIPFDILEKN